MDHVNTKEYLLKAVPLSFAFDGFFEIVPMTRSASEARIMRSRDQSPYIEPWLAQTRFLSPRDRGDPFSQAGGILRPESSRDTRPSPQEALSV